jgi:predicted nucleic acid-binding protein
VIDIDSATLDHAAELVSTCLRTLDAIHLTTALSVAPGELIAYDRRLLEAATGGQAHGFVAGRLTASRAT